MTKDESMCIQSRKDPYADYDSYNPDLDDYDIRSAPLLPPTQSPEEIRSKQATALRRRIARGGSWMVVAHYQRVVFEMENDNIKAGEGIHAISKRCEGRRARLLSHDSLSTTLGSHDASDSECMTPSSVKTPLDCAWQDFLLFFRGSQHDAACSLAQ